MNAEPANKPHAAVIGGGIVGCSTALHLLMQGFDVTLFDDTAPGTKSDWGQTSYGNAGAINAHSIVPMAGPGMMAKVPRWLMDPLGPLAIRWRHLPRAMPWLWQFVRSGATNAQVAQQAMALAPLYRDVVPAHRELAALSGVETLIRSQGCLTLYETESLFRQHAGARDLIREAGHTVEELNADEIRQLEPAFAPIFSAATFYPDASHCTDPGGLTAAHGRQVQRMGGRLVAERVASIETDAAGVCAVVTVDGTRHACSHAAVTAGAWSREMAQQVGEDFPLESERGYHMILPKPGLTTRRPVSFAERGFMTTTMDMGLRLAGTVEFAGLSAPPNWGRADKLLTHARDVFREVDTSAPDRWMGQRPATPDSLPVISRSRRVPNLVYGFGHGHLGLTGGPITGRQLALLLAGKAPEMDLSAFAIDRLAGKST